jgi:hypothetical protein
MSADHASQKLLDWLDDPEVPIPRSIPTMTEDPVMRFFEGSQRPEQLGGEPASASHRGASDRPPGADVELDDRSRLRSPSQR